MTDRVANTEAAAHQHPTRRCFLQACGVVASVAMGAGALSACSVEPPKPTMRDVARLIIEDMSLEDKVAQLFVVCPEQLSGTEVVAEPDQLYCERLQVFPVGGVIFNEANLIDTEQTVALLAQSQAAMQEEGHVPLYLCVDEEGGTVQRIGGKDAFGTPFIGNMSEIGEAQDEAAAAETARTIAQYLKPLGFNTDFAPSCDVAAGESSMMQLRSFGQDIELVSRMATAQILAFGEEGILCCAKHFPGIGDPEDDSHYNSISSQKTREELDLQLAPFAAAIEAGVPFIMMGHLALPAITGNDLPASVSSAIVQDILRDEMGYDGIVVTDSLSMSALTNFVEPQEAAVAAIEAGCDIALMPSDLQGAYNGLIEAVESERITPERIDQSLERILMSKLRAFPELFSEAIQDELAQCEENVEEESA